MMNQRKMTFPARLAGPTVVTIFFLIALSFQLFRISGQPDIVNLDHDASVLASFAAAMDHPDAFKNDILLSDKMNFQFYNTVHMSVLRTLAPLLDSYGKVFVAFTGIHVFVFLMGWYLFGMTLMRHHFWAALLACFLAIPTNLGYNDTWGVLVAEPLPRITFDSVLGFLFAAAIRWGHLPQAPFWILSLFGLSITLHPPNAVLVGLCTWLGLVLRRMQGMTIRAWLIDSAWMGIGFLLMIFIYLFSYHQQITHIPQGDPVSAYQLEQAAAPHLVDTLPDILKICTDILENGMFPLAIVAGLGIYFIGTTEQRQHLFQVIIWMSAIAAIVLLSILLQQSQWLAIQNLVYLLYGVHSIRYVFPLLIVLSIWSLSLYWTKFHDTVPTFSLGIGAIVFVLASTGTLSQAIPLIISPRQSYWDLLTYYDKRNKGNLFNHEMLNAVKQLTPVSARLLPLNVDAALIRYGARRSVVHGYWDSSHFSYSNPRANMEWIQREALVTDVKNLWNGMDSNDWREQFEIAIDRLLTSLKPDYIVSSRIEPSSIWERSGRKIIWKNSRFILIDVTESRYGRR
ncbi:MAG: hypothetical protein HQL77_12890 [Magnetococcales bacterium]|nr:hypothetical protein [Magnetococcales bacterium]